MLPLSTDADTASLWWAYVDRYVTRRSGAEAALVEVIEADPGLAVARAAALLMIGLDAADFDPAETAAAARRGVPTTTGSARSPRPRSRPTARGCGLRALPGSVTSSASRPT